MSVLDLFGKITLDTTEYDRGLDGAKAKALGMGGAIKNGLGFVAGTVTKGIGIASAAVGAFGASSVKAGMTFDTSMAQVAATMGKTTDQMLNETGTVELSWGTFTGNLRDYAQEMGANTVFSASQAADALNYMALAGYNTEKSMQTLPSVMNLASAGAMDLASASDMVTDTETALGLKSQRTSHLIDEMAKTASTTNTSVAQLGSAILTIGGTAKQLKGGFVEMANGEKVAYDGTTELSAALGILADNGIKGSAAGTTLRNMISSMTGKKWAKTFGDMGVAVYDASGEMRSMKDILADMSKAMDGMTTEEKTNLINSTFNARDLKSINALLATTGDRWDEIITGLNGSGEAGVMYAGKLYSMKDAQEQFGDAIYDTEQGFKVLGAAEMMAFQQMDNLNGDITLFKSALEGAQIAVSDRLTPSLRDFVKIGSEGLSEFTRKFKSGDISGAVKSVGTAIGKMAAEGAKKVPAMIKMGTKLLIGIGEGISQNLPELQKIAEDMLSGFGDFLVNNAPALIQSGAQMVNSILTGLAQQIPGIMSYGTTLITSLTESIVTALPELATGAWQIVESLYTGLMENIPRLAESAISIITFLGSGLAENIPLLAENALPLIEGFTGMLRENAGLIIDAGLNLLLNLAQGIANAIPTLVEYIPQIVINIAGIINDNAPKILEAGINIIITLGKGLLDAIPKIKENIPKIIQAIVAVWQAFNWVGLGKNVITFIGNGIKSLQANLPTMLKNIGEKGLNLFKSINWLNLGESVINFIGGGISSLIHLIPDLIVGIGTTAVNLFTSIDWLGLGSSVIGFIVNGIQAVVSHIPDALGIIAGLAMDTFKNVDWIGVGSTVIDTITDGLRSAVSGPLDLLRGLVDDILGFFDFKISFPSIELPHFSIDWEDVGWFSIPHVSIDWYAKAYDNPWLFTEPTVLGGKGFGDRPGGEIVYGHESLMRDIEEAVKNAGGQNRTFAPVINVYGNGKSDQELAKYIMDVMERKYRNKESVFA